jgi:pilus assembly protein CpaF
MNLQTRSYTSTELIDLGTISQSVFDSVTELVLQKKNGIICGGTGSGKTTLLQALLDHLPLDNNLLLIEHHEELKVTHPNTLRWHYQFPKDTAVMPPALLTGPLQHPDYIILDEIYTELDFALLQALNTGTCGILSTLHARSAADALARIWQIRLANSSVVQMTEAIDFVVYCERNKDRQRVCRLVTTT